MYLIPREEREGGLGGPTSFLDAGPTGEDLYYSQKKRMRGERCSEQPASRQKQIGRKGSPVGRESEKKNGHRCNTMWGGKKGKLPVYLSGKRGGRIPFDQKLKVIGRSLMHRKVALITFTTPEGNKREEEKAPSPRAEKKCIRWPAAGATFHCRQKQKTEKEEDSRRRSVHLVGGKGGGEKRCGPSVEIDLVGCKKGHCHSDSGRGGGEPFPGCESTGEKKRDGWSSR